MQQLFDKGFSIVCCLEFSINPGSNDFRGGQHGCLKNECVFRVKQNSCIYCPKSVAGIPKT